MTTDTTIAATVKTPDAEPILPTITLQFDGSQLFDTLAKVGDGGEALGVRIVSLMLMGGEVRFLDAFGLAAYGVTVVPALSAATGEA